MHHSFCPEDAGSPSSSSSSQRLPWSLASSPRPTSSCPDDDGDNDIAFPFPSSILSAPHCSPPQQPGRIPRVSRPPFLSERVCLPELVRLWPRLRDQLLQDSPGGGLAKGCGPVGQDRGALKGPGLAQGGGRIWDSQEIVVVYFWMNSAVSIAVPGRVRVEDQDSGRRTRVVRRGVGRRGHC